MGSFIQSLASRAKEVEEHAYLYYLAHRLSADWQREASAVLGVLGGLAAAFTVLDRKWLGIVLIVATVVVGIVAIVAGDKDDDEAREKHTLASVAYLALYHQACHCYWRIMHRGEDEEQLQACLQELLASSLEIPQTRKIWPGAASMSVAWLSTRIASLARYWADVRERKARDSAGSAATPASSSPDSLDELRDAARGAGIVNAPVRNIKIDRPASILVWFDTASMLVGAASGNTNQDVTIPTAPFASVAIITTTPVAGTEDPFHGK